MSTYVPVTGKIYYDINCINCFLFSPHRHGFNEILSYGKYFDFCLAALRKTLGHLHTDNNDNDTKVSSNTPKHFFLQNKQNKESKQ